MSDYSHPVLLNESDAIEGSTSYTDLKVSKNTIIIDKIDISNDEIKNLINDEKACISVFLENKNAYWSDTFNYNTLCNIKVDILPSFPEGDYDLEITVKTTSEIQFNLNSFGEDYKNITFDLYERDLICYIGKNVTQSKEL